MCKVQFIDANTFGYNFIAGEYIPEGQNEYCMRFKQNPCSQHKYRSLTFAEVELLIKNGNYCANWNDIQVEDPFNPSLIKGTMFAGLVRISSMSEVYLQYHDFVVPVGITGSKIISCDIGANCAIHYCAYLSHYIIGNKVILSRIDEMSATNHAKFGEGIVKEGEPEQVRVTIETINEAGGRPIYPFSKMICADAFIWAKYRGDTEFIKKLEEITNKSSDPKRGYYGTVGSGAVIKSCRIIKDVNIGECAYIKGANKLKNITINSSEDEPVQIGEGVELVNGIIGFGCRVFYGVKAVRFVIGNNCELKYGARFIHSVLGDNSTISCCEVLNSLIFPYHEQHHNNSFLIASLVQGQSNMAAGATVGSNHNTRGNDGEIVAGRGFWPGLSSTLKHNSRFASFVLLTKGNYPAELDIPLPFSLVIDNPSQCRLEIMPAYYWRYNMYALERNNKKFLKRDRRKTKIQKIETEILAPDSVYEILNAVKLIKKWIEKAWQKEKKEVIPVEILLKEHSDKLDALFIEGENIERSARPIKIIRSREALTAYNQMLTWYGVKNVAEYLKKHKTSLNIFHNTNAEQISLKWINMGGQLVPEKRFCELKNKIKSGILDTWDKIHNEYSSIYSFYEFDKAENAYAVLCLLAGVEKLSMEQWSSFLDEAVNIRRYIEKQIFITKNKDYDNRFRGITYDNGNEMNAVLGKVEDNALIIESKEDTKYYENLFNEIKQLTCSK